jgi:hypothetical protein
MFIDAQNAFASSAISAAVVIGLDSNVHIVHSMSIQADWLKYKMAAVK